MAVGGGGFCAGFVAGGCCDGFGIGGVVADDADDEIEEEEEGVEEGQNPMVIHGFSTFRSWAQIHEQSKLGQKL